MPGELRRAPWPAACAEGAAKGVIAAATPAAAVVLRKVLLFWLICGLLHANYDFIGTPIYRFSLLGGGRDLSENTYRLFRLATTFNQRRFV
jgi:hypothetical protein